MQGTHQSLTLHCRVSVTKDAPLAGAGQLLAPNVSAPQLQGRGGGGGVAGDVAVVDVVQQFTETALGVAGVLVCAGRPAGGEYCVKHLTAAALGRALLLLLLATQRFALGFFLRPAVGSCLCTRRGAAQPGTAPPAALQTPAQLHHRAPHTGDTGADPSTHLTLACSFVA